jgi:arsenate reductase
MAEGQLRHLAGDRFQVFSAGTKPKGVSGTTGQVMLEVGIDVSKHRSKPIDEFLDQEFDYLITVCDSARTGCPAFAGAKRKLHWPVKDPAELEGAGIASIDAFRAARDDLCRRIERLVASSVYRTAAYA